MGRHVEQGSFWVRIPVTASTRRYTNVVLNAAKTGPKPG